MKVCEYCGEEISGKDGENLCRKCEDNIEDAPSEKRKQRLASARSQRKWLESALRDCGLVKVRGALGGVYWE